MRAKNPNTHTHSIYEIRAVNLLQSTSYHNAAHFASARLVNALYRIK